MPGTGYTRSTRRWWRSGPCYGIYTCHFFELTQVCTQIRQEFHSMCLASISKWILFSSFDDYAKVFHRNGEVTDTIVVDIESIAGKSTDRVNLLNLFHHLSTYANVTCTFGISLNGVGRGQSLHDLRPILDRVAEQAATTEWKEAGSKLTSIIPKTTNKNLVINVKPEFKARGLRRKDFKADLCRKLGLRSEGKWSVIVKYE